MLAEASEAEHVSQETLLAAGSFVSALGHEVLVSKTSTLVLLLYLTGMLQSRCRKYKATTRQVNGRNSKLEQFDLNGRLLADKSEPALEMSAGWMRRRVSLLRRRRR